MDLHGQRNAVLATKDRKEHGEGVWDMLVLYAILGGRMSE